MTPEEKTPEMDPDSNPQAIAPGIQESSNTSNPAKGPLAHDGEPVRAEFADSDDVEYVAEIVGLDSSPSGIKMSKTWLRPTPPMSSNMENMAANGGAIGALMLGIWCVLGSFITNWSVINGVLGLLMGVWGLSSRKKRTAWIGMFLCCLGILLSMAQIGDLINTYINAVDETLIQP